MLLKKISQCARCGGDHFNIETKPLTHPVLKDDSDEALYTHWAPCPTNGEPILCIEFETSVDRPHMTAVELEVRMRLWVSHGHSAALYGDDGEMQCCVCRADYKRDPLPDLVSIAFQSRKLEQDSGVVEGKFCAFCGSDKLITSDGADAIQPRRGCTNCNRWLDPVKVK